MPFLITTTGTSSTIVLNDIGGRTITHPTIDLDLELEFTKEELINSSDIKSAIDAGHITAEDANGNIITSSEGLNYIPMFIGATSELDGECGLVPGPTAGKESSFLRGDGSWDKPGIIIKDEGSEISGGPHNILNFVGPQITATNSGNNQATITVNRSLIKSTFVEVEKDISTTTDPEHSLPLLSINTIPNNSSSKFCIFFSASGYARSVYNAKISFQLWYGLTGFETIKRSTFIYTDYRDSGSCALNLKLGALGAGQHTIQIRWGVAYGTAYISPSSNKEYDHCSLLVQEVSV